MKLDTLAIVIIGRNEGQRLVDCLNALAGYHTNVFYVDSASTDDSIMQAKSRGAHVVELDMRKPFTAARARNAGVLAATEALPNLQYIQFLDGDCIVNGKWLDQAISFLTEHPEVAVVCGRRRERYPERTIYNQLCDIEWDTPVGEAKACGGDALMRAAVVKAVGGYRETLIAGEEPELCVRIRRAGHKVWRLDAEMTLHDAAMTRFSQWWKRSVRAGYAFAEGAYLHGDSPERHWVAETRRAWFWAGFLPLVIVLSNFVNPMWCLLLLIYPLQILRMMLKSGRPRQLATLEAFYSVLGKFAELYGQIKFLFNQYTKQQGSIIEYK
jgi:GT2 family glycosyltransferase